MHQVGTGSKKILVVEDEFNIRRLVRVNLEKAGYSVIEAENGEIGLEIMSSDRPDLVILDIMMPKLDGLETIRRAKADAKLSPIPVIFLTAKAQDQDVLQGWQEGCEMYLTKPFNPLDLLIVIKRILAACEEGETGIINL